MSRAVGRSLLRKEDHVLLRGRGRFVDDIRPPGTLEAAVLRSPHGHARLGSVDARAALALPGVHAVLTAGDLPEGGPPIPMRMYRRDGMERFLQRPLASGTVRYAGEPVAVVVADARYVAEDALDLIQVEYEPLPAVVSAEAALAGDAPLLHPSAGTNLAAEFTIVHGDVDGAFAAAAHVVETAVHCGRHAAVPLEPRGVVAWIADDGRLVVHGPTKVVHINRRMLAALLGRPEESIRYVEPHVGGGFGARGEFYPEDYLVPLCALRLGRPVAWTEDRSEALRTTNHSRDQVVGLALAIGEDGRFLALRGELTIDTGAYVRTHGGVVPGLSAALLPGPYAWQAFSCRVRQVVTNKTPSGTYRGPGRYETTLARERAVDIAARRLGLDPAELRRLNLVTPDRMPWPNGSNADGHPIVYDSGDYPKLLESGLARFGYEERLAWRATVPAHPALRRGVGLAFFVEKSGIARWEYARVALATAGDATVYAGSASVGQGVETVLAQVCADALGVPYDEIEVRHGDTDEVPDGIGSFGSRATSLAGAAVAQAAATLRKRVLDAVGIRLEVAPADLELRGDRVVAVGAPARSVPLAQLAADGVVLEEAFVHRSEEMSYPYGLHCAAVEVDVETGGVDVQRYTVAYDVGRAINPRLVAGQIEGGLAQGLGGALLEEFPYDADGQPLAGNLVDYLLPTAVEVPHVDVLISEDAPTPRSPIGAKGAGEGGATASGGCIANAIADALGCDVLRTPMLPGWIVGAAAAPAGRARA